LFCLCKHSGGGREERAALRSCHTREGEFTVRFRLQKRDVAQKFRGSVFIRRGCATSVSRFCKLHLGRCDKDSAPSRSSLPPVAKSISKRKHGSVLFNKVFVVFHAPLLSIRKAYRFAGEHVPKRSACGARPSGAGNRGKKGGKLG